MSRLIADIHRARNLGKLPERFRAADVKKACPGWAEGTYTTFLSKHCVGNPDGCTEYFERHAVGLYSLIGADATRALP